MKHLQAMVILAFLFAGIAEAGQERPKADSTSESSHTTPEWTDHNAHDPGATEAGKTTPHERTGTETKPSQSKVLVAPAAMQSQDPCSPKADSTTSAKAADREGGTLTFGDGEHGRIPQTEGGGCADPATDSGAGNGSNQEDGDTDRPVVTGRVSNPDKED
jgi:hypothetical protein